MVDRFPARFGTRGGRMLATLGQLERDRPDLGHGLPKLGCNSVTLVRANNDSRPNVRPEVAALNPNCGSLTKVGEQRSTSVQHNGHRLGHFSQSKLLTNARVPSSSKAVMLNYWLAPVASYRLRRPKHEPASQSKIGGRAYRQVRPEQVFDLTPRPRGVATSASGIEGSTAVPPSHLP